MTTSPSSLLPTDSLLGLRVESLAILISGGVDSAVLLAEALQQHITVCPLYIRHGLVWETDELHYLKQFLKAQTCPYLRPLSILEMPLKDLYGNHWSITSRHVPDAHTPDEAVFLPGRNVLLLAKALIWCHLHSVDAVALAPLESNPFPDATPAFFAAFQDTVNQSVGGRVRVLLPYRRLSKVEVLHRGRSLPLEWTFSCIQPADGRHCGRCNKCAERHRAFVEAQLADPTDYAQEIPCIA